MKISTILILTTVLVILGFLVAFNFKMKQEYDYELGKGQYQFMEFTPLKGVEKIDFKLADGSRVKIVQGTKEGMWINKRVRDNVKFEIAGHTLSLSLSHEHTRIEFSSWNADIVITTKTLNALEAYAYYNDHSEFKSNSDGICFVEVDGHQPGQFDLKIGEYVNVSLDHMQMDTLKADIGEISKKAELTLLSGVKAKVAQINIPGNGLLNLYNPKIVKTSYNLSDAATVAVNGKIVKMIK